MTRYPFRADLKAPARLNLPDFSNPKLAFAVRVLVKNLLAQTRDFTPPPGVCLRLIEVSSWDGAQIECLVLEPADESAPLPGMLYCHGGGFFLPLQPMMLQLACRYAAALQMRVFLPEYRLLPEAPAPAAFEDCLAVWREMTAQADALGLDAGRLLLYGESAGGTLAAGLAQRLCAEEGPRPAGQLLIYPVLDDRCGCYPSMERYANAAWPRHSNEYMWREYLRELPEAVAPLVPMRAAPADLARLPAAYIEPQEIDTLHDEAAAYAEALRDAGTTVEVNEVPGSYHGFDADTENLFVQAVVGRRIRAMRAMLDNINEGARI